MCVQCFDALGSINYLAVLVSVFVVMALGALWYSPVLFGKIWAKAIGINMEDLDPKDAVRGMVVSVFTSFTEMTVLALMINLLNIVNLWDGVKLGLLLSLGIMGTATLSNSMYDQRDIKVWLISVSYRGVYAAINGAILTVWQ